MSNISLPDLQEIEQEIFQYLRMVDRAYKLQRVRINISSSFMARALCKECGKGPAYYYHVRLPFIWKDVSDQIIGSKWFRSWIKRLVSDWYLVSEPRYFRDISEFSASFPDAHYNPTAHMKRGLPKVEKDNVMEMLGCECGATVWAFNQKSTKNRPEVINRKGRYKYPRQFEY
jgi:hypothetical protein